MILGITGKTAIIGASSGGIGKGIALELAKEGVNVAIMGRDSNKLAAAKEEILSISTAKVLAKTCDLRDNGDIHNFYNSVLAEFGSVEILINNHGGPKAGSFMDISLEDTNEALSMCFHSTTLLTKLCLPNMIEMGWGRIVNVLSLSAREPIKGMYLSNIIRPALLGFAKTLSTEYADKGITVNNVLPSAVLSDRTSYFINQSVEKNGSTFDLELKKIEEGLPNRHIATPEEFAQTVLYLCSKNSSYVNGTSIAIDGGISRGLF